MIGMIPTVTGGILPKDLGPTSLHEHISLDCAGGFWQDAYEYAVQELRKARDLGLRTIVEVSPRRDIRGIKRVSEEAGVNVVVCTGFSNYTVEEKGYSIERYRNHMLDEISTGIGGTGIRAGVMKVWAADFKIQEYEARAFAAAARVQKETGLPICTHAVSGCANQQRILEDNGADLSRVYFSHVEAEFGWEGRTIEQEIEYLTRVVEKGSTLSFNNFGNWAHTRAENLSLIIRELISRGFSERLAATIDMGWDYDGEGRRKILWEDINEDGKRRTYAYLLSDVVPWLRNIGVDEADISRMLKDNPRRLLHTMQEGNTYA